MDTVLIPSSHFPVRLVVALLAITIIVANCNERYNGGEDAATVSDSHGRYPADPDYNSDGHSSGCRH